MDVLLSSFAIMALPALLFTGGLSLALGRLSGNALYVLFFVIIILGFFNIQRPLITDLFGNVLQITVSYIIDLRTYSGGPLIAILPWDFLAGRLIFTLLGLGIAIAATVKPILSKSEKARPCQNSNNHSGMPGYPV
jgi:hypothetical protein